MYERNHGNSRLDNICFLTVAQITTWFRVRGEEASYWTEGSLIVEAPMVCVHIQRSMTDILLVHRHLDYSQDRSGFGRIFWARLYVSGRRPTFGLRMGIL